VTDHHVLAGMCLFFAWLLAMNGKTGWGWMLFIGILLL
jgi:hypothetical protein